MRPPLLHSTFTAMFLNARKRTALPECKGTLKISKRHEKSSADLIIDGAASFSGFRGKKSNWGKLRGKTYSAKVQTQLFSTKMPKSCSKKERTATFRSRFFGSGRRIRTLTYGVRVRCATITQSRYVRCFVQRTNTIIAKPSDLSRGNFTKKAESCKSGRQGRKKGCRHSVRRPLPFTSRSQTAAGTAQTRAAASCGASIRPA